MQCRKDSREESKANDKTLTKLKPQPPEPIGSVTYELTQSVKGSWSSLEAGDSLQRYPYQKEMQDWSFLVTPHEEETGLRGLGRNRWELPKNTSRGLQLLGCRWQRAAL